MSGNAQFGVLTWSEDGSLQKFQLRNGVIDLLTVRLFYYMLVEESVNQTKWLITFVENYEISESSWH